MTDGPTVKERELDGGHDRQIDMERMRSRTTVAWVFLGLGAMAAGCSSRAADTSASTVNQRAVVISTPAYVERVVVATGDVVSFLLPPESGHRPGGGAVAWPSPTSSDPTVLQADGQGTCRYPTTCTRFVALTRGSATLTVLAPGGVICGGDFSECAGVFATIFRIPVQVLPGGSPQVVRRQGTS